MPQTYGYPTQDTIFLTMESHKLHKEFAVAADVRFSQPVKLTSTGEITPLVSADNRNLCIGVSVHNAKTGGLATIAMKGYTTILCVADGDVTAGPVEYTGFTNIPSTVTDSPLYGNNKVKTVAATAATIFGWAIEGAESGGKVEVVILA